MWVECPSKMARPGYGASAGTSMRIVEASGITMGRNDREAAATGDRIVQGTEGATMGPPTAELYPVDPEGVDMMRPSDFTVVIGLPSTKQSKLPRPGFAPLSSTTSFRQ